MFDRDATSSRASGTCSVFSIFDWSIALKLPSCEENSMSYGAKTQPQHKLIAQTKIHPH